MPTNGQYNFPTLTWEKFNEVYGDPENPELVTDYLWNIVYVLERENYGTNGACYYAEASQLPAEPTREDVEQLILSLFAEGTATTPETV